DDLGRPRHAPREVVGRDVGRVAVAVMDDMALRSRPNPCLGYQHRDVAIPQAIGRAELHTRLALQELWLYRAVAPAKLAVDHAIGSNAVSRQPSKQSRFGVIRLGGPVGISQISRPVGLYSQPLEPLGNGRNARAA